MIYNLNDWPEGHVGHLVPSEEVINAFIEKRDPNWKEND